MPLIYAGIDEAGYGPLLGPLCVGAAVFRIENWSEGERAPNLWKLLSTSVCRSPTDKRRRIAVDDSKALKLPNDSPKHHPLTHLERGVLTFLNVLAREEGASPLSHPAHDLELFERLGAGVPEEPWYAGDPLTCPVSTTADAIGVSCNMLRQGLERAGVSVLHMRCRAMGEGTFNEIVKTGGSKAAATEAALVEHLWTIWERWGTVGAAQSAPAATQAAAPVANEAASESGADGSGGVATIAPPVAPASPATSSAGGVRVVCDRQGGRAYYSDMLRRAFPEAVVTETHACETQSRYEIAGVGDDGRHRHMHVLFLVESERHHLPVALASMLAKLTRESMMARFNRYWCGRLPELKPTAGYRNDAWRWLDDAKGCFQEGERAKLVRCA